jgi:hypothetical protein
VAAVQQMPPFLVGKERQVAAPPERRDEIGRRRSRSQTTVTAKSPSPPCRPPQHRIQPDLDRLHLGGFDEMDDVRGDGSAELLDDGSIEIEFAYHNGGEAVLKAKRDTSSTA